MPRQPFPPKHKGKHFCFDNRGIETNVPAAALVGRIIAEWSRVEHQMAMVMAAMLGDTPAAGVALFTTLRNARAQREAMSAVGATIITGDMAILFEATLALYTAIGKERHSLAHGILGWSFDIPHVTLWVSSSDLANYESEAWFRFTTTPYDRKTHNHDSLESLIYVYSTECLQALLTDVDKANNSVALLYRIIRHKKNSASEEYLQLSNEPRVSGEIARIRQDKKNNR